MKDFLFKLRLLLTLVLAAADQWRTEIWREDLDGYYCCSGDDPVSPCGCDGLTVRDVYSPRRN